MDGIARVSVDPLVMEYVMHCMYDAFLRIQKGLRVSISWHRDDDTVMITSTSRPATRDLHLALNRFYVLYNTLKRNLTFQYCQLHETQANNFYVINKIRDRYRRIHVQATNNNGEIKLWGFKSELAEALKHVNEILDTQVQRLGTPVSSVYEGYTTQKRWAHHLPQLRTPSVKSQAPDRISFEKEVTSVILSKSLGRKLSNSRSTKKAGRISEASPPSRYSTSEIKRFQQQSKAPQKVSTFPKINSQKRMISKTPEEIFEVQTPTGLTVSTCLCDHTLKNTPQILVNEISSKGRLSDEASWMIAKSRSFEIIRIIKLHVSLYGEVAPSRVIVTPGFSLPYNYLIHATPPSWDEWSQKKCQRHLLNEYKNILRVADRDMNLSSISFPILGRCATAGFVFPENVALQALQQAIVNFTKFGLRSLRHVRILCSRLSELEFVRTTVFTHVVALKYDPRYLSQQRRFFPDIDESNHELDDDFGNDVRQSSTHDD